MMNKMQQKNTYKKELLCYDCGTRFIQEFEKGKRIKRSFFGLFSNFIKDITCPNCEIKGECHEPWLI